MDRLGHVPICGQMRGLASLPFNSTPCNHGTVAGNVYDCSYQRLSNFATKRNLREMLSCTLSCNFQLLTRCFKLQYGLNLLCTGGTRRELTTPIYIQVSAIYVGFATKCNNICHLRPTKNRTVFWCLQPPSNATGNTLKCSCCQGLFLLPWKTHIHVDLL